MEGSNEGFERQRAKRKRVARMKKFIVTTVLAFMLITITVMGFLVYEVFSLQRQINALSKQIYTATDVADNVEMIDDSYLDGVYKVEDIDNEAQEGDIPKVYLTFDDGPSDNTDAILDILDDYNVKATFFVVGDGKEDYAEQYKRIVDEGHTIGMHSYSHAYKDIYSSEEAFITDYNKIHEMILDYTGVDSKLYRFPGGSSTNVGKVGKSVFINYLNEQGVQYYDWNVVSGDATSQAYTSEQLIDNVMTDVVKYKTSVVLLHDASDKGATVEALPGLIEALQAQGAMILPITDETTVIHHVNVVQ